MADAWKDWWRKRGDERLSLLLWAVWNPIGYVPLDEYASYTGQVVRPLQQAHDADEALSQPGAVLDEAQEARLQHERNKLHAESVQSVATLLESLRCE